MMKKKQFSQMWKERALSMALLFMLSTIYVFAQKVTGVVKDSSGDPLVGVNVVEKGSTTNGAVTNIKGEYQINVATGKTLVFSYIGYEKKEVTVKNSKLNVFLKEDSKVMGDVVVVGYGTMQRKDVTSSITTVKAEDLNRGVFTDPAQMLQGKVPGLVVTSSGDPNGSPSITLRGASSLRTGEAMSPYYVIDGIPGVDISMIAPDDVESIDVLRDATATAIYGSKAANGVIIITTKSGKNGKTNVSYNGYVGFDVISKTLDMMDADGLRSLANNYGVKIDDNGGNMNWQDEVLRTGVSHNHNLSINGGNETTKFMASINYMNRQGIIKNTEMKRLNARSLVTTKVLKDHLDLAAGINIMQGNHDGVSMRNEGGSVMDAMNYYSPLNPIYDTNGNWFFDNSSKSYNPASMLYEDRSADTWKRQQFTAKATLHIIKGLDWNANYSYGNRQFVGNSYNSRESQVEKGKNGVANRNTSTGSDNTFETYVNYNQTFNKIHKLGIMAGYSWEERNNGDGFGLTVNNFFDDYVKYNNITYAANVNGIQGLSSGIKSPRRDISFYGRANYSFNSRYMLQATVRRDGSSVFGANNRWGTFPSVSAAWNITEEDFMKDQEVFSNLKLRAGYGVSGNARGFSTFSALATYGTIGYFDYTDKNGVTTTYATLNATKNANPDLKWESTGMLNIGIDYAFLGGRINGSIEFYNKKTSDLIWSYPVSTNKYPYGWIDANVGSMTNRGIEFTINADVIQSRGFRWNTTLNLSHNMNRVDKLSNDMYHTDLFSQGDPMVAGVSANGYTQRIMEGEALGTFYTYEYAGIDSNGRATYYEHDETTGARTGAVTNDPQTKDRTITGCAQPKLNLGWNNTFTWKDWTATVFFTGIFGNDIYNGSRANYMSASLLSGGKNVLKDFAAEQVVNGKMCTDENRPSDRWIENGSYLRLQTLTIGYTFRNCFDGWVKDITLYGTANNLLTITGYKGLDPEVNMGGTDPGIDYRWSHYPHTRTFMVGAKVNF